MDQLSWEVPCAEGKGTSPDDHELYGGMLVGPVLCSECHALGCLSTPLGRQQAAVEGPSLGLVCFLSGSAVFPLIPNPSSDHWEQKPSPLTGHPGTCFKFRCWLFFMDMWFLTGNVISHWKNTCLFCPHASISLGYPLPSQAHQHPTRTKTECNKKCLQSIDSGTSCTIKHLKKHWTYHISMSLKIDSLSKLSVSTQFSSVAQLCLTLCNPMDYSTPGFPNHHQLPKLAQTHVHWVHDAIQPSHSLSSPSPAFNLSQQQGLFQWVSSSHQVAKVLEFQL